MSAENERETRERRRGCRRPLVDVFETDDDVVLQVELPGIRSDQIKIDVDEDVLRLETTARREEQEEAGEAVLREFTPTNFYREFVLSRELDRENVAASWKNGVLTLKVPKGAAKTHKIEVEAS